MAIKKHYLKVAPGFFGPLLFRTKTFEVRRDDRRYALGDVLWLQEWTEEGGYSGRAVSRRVVYMLRGGQYGIEPGFVVLGLE